MGDSLKAALEEIRKSLILFKLSTDALDHVEVKIKALKERDDFLEALEQCGVDNWGGYGDAQDMVESWDKQTEKKEE